MILVIFLVPRRFCTEKALEPINHYNHYSDIIKITSDFGARPHVRVILVIDWFHSILVPLLRISTPKMRVILVIVVNPIKI